MNRVPNLFPPSIQVPNFAFPPNGSPPLVQRVESVRDGLFPSFAYGVPLQLDRSPELDRSKLRNLEYLSSHPSHRPEDQNFSALFELYSQAVMENPTLLALRGDELSRRNENIPAILNYDLALKLDRNCLRALMGKAVALLLLNDKFEDLLEAQKLMNSYEVIAVEYRCQGSAAVREINQLIEQKIMERIQAHTGVNSQSEMSIP